MWNKPVSRDKILHFLGGYAITHVITALSVIIGLMQLNPMFSHMDSLTYITWSLKGLLFGFIVVVVSSFIKEEYDRRNPDRHTKDPEDILAAVVGSAAFALSTCMGLVITVHFYV